MDYINSGMKYIYDSLWGTSQVSEVSKSDPIDKNYELVSATVLSESRSVPVTPANPTPMKTSKPVPTPYPCPKYHLGVALYANPMSKPGEEKMRKAVLKYRESLEASIVGPGLHRRSMT